MMSTSTHAVPTSPLAHQRPLISYLPNLTWDQLYQIVARLTLLLLALYGPKYWEMHVPSVMCAAVGLVWPAAIRSSLYWTVMLGVVGSGVAARLYVLDNHKVLLVYWLLALAAAGGSPGLLRRNARLLIGLCFLFATLWKMGTLNFVRGDFLAWEMLTDQRFSNFTQLALGVSDAEMAANSSRMDAFMMAGKNEVLSYPAHVGLAAKAMTAWTLFIESSIAASFLLSNRYALARRSRNWLLLIFVSTTYPIATVIGFGWLLSIMGLAQCYRRERASIACYVLLFIAMQAYLIPWGSLFHQAS